jgi:two-component system, NtrC family, sensor kinase
MKRPPRQGGPDIEPILTAIVRTAARLCDARYAHLHLVDGDRLAIAAKHGRLPRTLSLGESLPLSRGSVAGRAVVDRRTVHVRDLKVAAKSQYPDAAGLQRAAGLRTMLATPLVQDGRAVGALVVLRTTVRPFTAHQIALLKTFAEQAAIALENARLSRELEARNGALSEALEQQTATGEILSVISSSPTEIQPVLAAVVKSAARFCGAYDASIFLRDGDGLRVAAHHGPIPAPAIAIPIVPGSVGGLSVLERRPVHVVDLQKEAEEFPEGSAFARSVGHRATLSVPLLREGEVTGVIQLRRLEAEPFTDRQISLLQSFADQAVIAIENVHLFTELGVRNHDLTETLEQQTATSEILRVISQSQTDVQPVFDSIVRSAVRLCDGIFGVLFRFDGELLHQVAEHNFTPDALAEARRAYPAHPHRGLGAARAILDVAVVQIADAELDPEYRGLDLARAVGWRSGLFVPMMREGAPIGVVSVLRAQPGVFADREVELLKTFADQAVIAIENVRLFTELGARNHDLTEALEQQTATSEILRVISSSPTDLQPVFDIIAESAVKLCGAEVGLVTRLEGEWVEVKAVYGTSAVGREAIRRVYPMRPSGAATGARAIRDCAIAHIPDVLAEEGYGVQEAAIASGFRAALGVPMVREGRAIGSIAIGRAEAGEFSERQIKLLCTFADQAVIAIENVRLFTELGARNRDLSESLEQQTATSEILQVISSSPTDLQPVFDIIAESAVKLCGAEAGLVTRFDGEWVEVKAMYGSSSAGTDALRRTFPMRPSGAGAAVRAIRDRAIAHIPDVLDDREYNIQEAAVAGGFRAVLAVPMLREGRAIGSVGIGRSEAGPFSERQIRLLQTFADQAMIAIENVRLFTELEARNQELTDSLTQQTATAEILRVISSSPTDIQPVLDAVLESAARLCEAVDSQIFLQTGDELREVAHRGPIHSGHVGEYTVPIVRGTVNGRVMLEARTVHVDDLAAESGEFPEGSAIARKIGHRTVLGVPLMREGVPVGTIAVRRSEVRPFSERQIALLQTFADQAVIAIENVRLFTELGARNRDLTEALSQQTATSEILRVISQSQTDVQPVFDTIARSSVSLCDGVYSGVYQLDGDLVRMVAQHGMHEEALEEFRRIYPRRLSEAGGAVGKAIKGGTTVHFPDVREEPTMPEWGRRLSHTLGYRTQLVVPMMRQGVCIGVVSIARPEVRPFSESIIALIQTFADQAVIAIENVRLVTELGVRNHDLTESLEQQTATSEILRVISQSPTDVQPVFDTIAKNARRLCNGDSASVLILDGTHLRLETVDNASEEGAEALRAAYPSPVSHRSAGGRAVLTGRAVHIPDVLEDPDYEFAGLQSAGLRSMLSVPMLRHGTAIGTIVVHTWGTPRPFSSKQMELLQTFADQAVIAVENVRLFKELQARTNELTRSVDQLTALGEISQAVSSTLDVETVLQTIVSRATQLAGADGCAIYEYDDATEAFHIRATHNLDPVLVGTLRASPLRKGEGAMGRAAETREPTQVADIAAPGAYQSHIRDTLLGAGYRALLSVPLLREGEIIGSLSLNRHAPGEFPPEAVEVLKTFATQSALAIQNARLFREIADKSRLLEAASRHKSEFLANMSHELRTPLNAIIGFSEVLNERMFGELNDKQAEYLKDIHTSGTHLLSLINDILDLSKVEAGRMELELSDFSLPAAIDSALTLVRERATRRGVTLRAAIHPDLGEMSGDERKIRQVLLNLLSNAIKFTPEGGRIEVTAVPENGGVDVSVIDTGVGIAPEDHEAVFEEFRQVGESAAKQEGTGLGLALCRKFVELHGGKIWVTSALGAGSTFTFRLPVRS